VDLSSLHPAPGARRSRKRVGRGPGSGLGKTSGRGHKGSNARAGGGPAPGYEGGQMPLQRRLPKRGFRNLFRKSYAVVNLAALNRFDAGSVVDAEALVSAGLATRNAERIKILGQGTLERKLTVRVHAASASARAAIEGQGGTLEVVE
jgi:large subunit ribosomal protein L15